MCSIIDNIKHASRVLKNDLYRCGSRVALRNVTQNIITNVHQNMNVQLHNKPTISHLLSENNLNKPVIKKFRHSKFRNSVLLFFTLLLGMVFNAMAGEFCVANPQFNGVIDGNVAYTSPPMSTITQITIDGDCTFKNFTAANPLDVTINYQTTGGEIYLITFDNVIFTGNMACSAIDHKLWVVNTPEGAFSGSCQDIIIPPETIAKDIPSSTAGIGVPFTYTLTLPSMQFPVGDPSPNDLGNIVLTDDLNAMGVDVTLVGTPTVEWKSGGAVAHTFTNTAGLLKFVLPSITSGDQIVIKITLVLNDTVTNVEGTQFTNTAEWVFSRWIDLDENGILEDGVPLPAGTGDADGDGILEDEFFDPLSGESGTSDIMTIAGPGLEVSKTSSESALNIGIQSTFTIDVQNNGGSDAWHTTISDELPVGMCAYDPTASVTAEIFAADGTTSVAVLNEPTDFVFTKVGCDLTFVMQTATAVIEPDQHLIVTYKSELDAAVLDGTVLTNIAGATQWFSNDVAPRRTYTKVLDAGDGLQLHEDTAVVTAALSGYYFQKTVINMTTGEDPATTAVPGDKLRYKLRLFNLDQNVNDITITDVIDTTKFDTATFDVTPFADPQIAGSVYSFNPATGLLTIEGDPALLPATLDLSPPVPPAIQTQIVFKFDINVLSTLTNGTTVANQARIDATGTSGALIIVSDDPRNGIDIIGDLIPPDTTNVIIQSPGPLAKANVQTTAAIGEEFTYRITIPATPISVAMYDVRILDDLTLYNTDMTYKRAAVHTGDNWTLTNVKGTAISLVIEDLITGIDIPAGTQAIFDITVQLLNTANNNKDDLFINTAKYSYNRVNADEGSRTTSVTADSPSMTIVEPAIVNVTKDVTNVAYLTPTAGETIRYKIILEADSVGNISDVFDVGLTDSLEAGLVYVGNPTVTTNAGVSADNTISDPVITGDGSTANPQVLVWGLSNGTADIDIEAGSTITVEYDVQVLNSVLANQVLTNSVVADWTSVDDLVTNERDGSDGIGGLNDYITTATTLDVTVPDIVATIAKDRIDDTYGTADANIRIGDIVEYRINLSVPEGTLVNAKVVDTLPQGLDFIGIVSINGDTDGAPYVEANSFNYADILATDIVEAGDPVTGPSTVTWNLGSITNQAIDNTTNDFTIIYRARVLKDSLDINTTTINLNNEVVLTYDTAVGVKTIEDLVTNITALQPKLTITKTAVPAGGDNVIVANETVTYTLEFENTGDAPAYDLNILDTIPVGMRDTAVTAVAGGTEIETDLGVISTLADPTLGYTVATGEVTIDLDSGVAGTYTIPVGYKLRIQYQATANAAITEGVTLTNSADATYYSFDDDVLPEIGVAPTLHAAIATDRQTYTVGPATSTIYSGAPPTKVLDPLATTTATIGDAVTYIITVPGKTNTSTLYDVDISDLLDANLVYDSVTITGLGGGGVGVTNNFYAGTNELEILADEIPAGAQVQIEVHAFVKNISGPVDGDVINNQASYTYAFTDGGATEGALATSIVPLKVIEPDVTLEKTGPATMRLGIAETFTLNVHNTGNSTAWDLTVVDILPNPTPGGMCDTSPLTTLAARTTLVDGTTVVNTLVAGADYDATYDTGTCTLTLTMKSTNAAIAPDNRLIITYDAELDSDNVQGVTLTNLAGVTEWFSLDTAGAGATGEIRTYIRAPPDIATAGLAADHEDLHEVDTEIAVVQVLKSVYNVTSGASGANASPGDRLRYTIRFENISAVELTDFSFVDELDALNTTPAFATGTLVLDMTGVPGTPDVSNTNDSGGTNGTGIIDIRNLILGEDGSATEIVTFSFEVDLATSINHGTVVKNQGQMTTTNLDLETDDPAIAGAEDPTDPADQQPTETLIASAPLFNVEKTSQDLTGDAAILLAGDTLHYTITVKNIGNENTVNSILRDQLPANTTYVTGSTRLNGNVVADSAGPTLPLQDGILIHAPEDTTPGAMRADATATTNIATITFDVVINASVVTGTIISNQAYLDADGAGSGLMPTKASDDPDTATVDDPTRDVIGNLPLLDVTKTVAISNDLGTPGELDPNDRIRYTITITNIGASDATQVTFTDAIPADTTYYANSVELNTLTVGQPDGGVSPLVAGIDVSSKDITDATGLPTPGNGTISVGQTATITFEVTVNGGTPVGTIISNQGSVDSYELPVELTDADGIDSNGDQPTLIAVGLEQLVNITKTVSVVGGGPALAGGQLEYRVEVNNIGTVTATDIVITDDLEAPVPGQLTYVPASATLNGLVAGTSYSLGVVKADYGATYGNLAPGSTVVLIFRATINAALPIGTTITNTGVVDWKWNTLTDSASVSIDVGGTPGVANVNGKVWHDSNYNNVYDSGEIVLANWFVDIYHNTTLLGTVNTDVNGDYSINGLVPNYIGTDRYDIRFRAPGSNATTAKLGLANSAPVLGYIDAQHRIYDIVLNSGANIVDLNLSIDPNGVVYDSVIRTPVTGATVTLLNAGTGIAVSSGCFDDVNQQNQITTANGYYKFDLNFSQIDCTAGDDYLVRYVPPATGYTNNPSVVITPQTHASTAALDVPNCPGGASDAIPATANICEATVSEVAPTTAVQAGSAGTNYYLHLTLSDGALPDDSQLFNNHLPVDPILNNAVNISKTSSLVNVTRSQLVPYSITVKNGLPVILSNSNIIDTLPAGFKYIQDSARLNGVATEPTQSGLQLIWGGIDLVPNVTQTIKLLLIVGGGVNEGEYVNRAQVFDTVTNTAASEIASATVRVIPDPAFDCTDIIGKVFDDKNLNGYQDESEKGIAGVKLVTLRGLETKTDKYGRFHVTCAISPNESRGSNFVIKLDERSLPTGYRMTTENPRVQRTTRGKMMKFNFGSTVHRVVSMDLADDVFVNNSTEIHKQWLPRIDLLVKQLKEKPSILRLSYLADADGSSIVDDRLEKVKQDIVKKWLIENKYKLRIETEIYWRRGSTPDTGDID